MEGGDNRDTDGRDEDFGGEVREQDHLLPIANIGRIMKNGVPASAKISKDAKETVQECVSEFISFITSEANDKCLQEKRKTINGDDLIHAMKSLGFDNYIDPLSIYLNRYKEVLNAEAAAESLRVPRRNRDDGEEEGMSGPGPSELPHGSDQNTDMPPHPVPSLPGGMPGSLAPGSAPPGPFGGMHFVPQDPTGM